MKEQKIADTIKKIINKEDGITWASSLITDILCGEVSVLTEKGFKYTFRHRDGIITDLLIAYPPKGKPWSTQQKENYLCTNPCHLLTQGDRQYITNQAIKVKLGYKVDVKEYWIVEVNGAEVKEAVFDKGPAGGLKYPREEMGRNRHESEDAARFAAKKFNDYYKKFLENK